MNVIIVLSLRDFAGEIFIGEAHNGLVTKGLVQLAVWRNGRCNSAEIAVRN